MSREPKMTVYVIDDDESVRISFARLLRSESFMVQTFSSLREFLDQSAHKKDSCIVADLGTLDQRGPELAERLSLQGAAKTPLIVISVSDDAQGRQRARELGAVAFFRKPLDDQALLDAVIWAIAGEDKSR